jgi:hypothetical protein
MKFYDVEQYTEEWRRLRMGRPTASQFYLIVDPEGKGKARSLKERKRYLYRLVAERILDEPMPDRFGGNEFTEHGQNYEPIAAEAFQKKMGVTLENGGIVTTDDGRLGCSPDRMFSKHREALEIKCLAAWTHAQYLCEGPPSDRFKQQTQGQILVGEFCAVHLFLYHPNLKLSNFYLEILPDERFLNRLREQLNLFCEEINEAERFIRRKGHKGVEEAIRRAVNE